MSTPRPSTAFNPDGLKAYEPLASLIHTDRAGGRYNFEDSLSGIVGHMNFTLEEIAAGEWNGMPIKDPARVPEHLEHALKPLLDAGEQIMQAVGINEGFTSSLSVDFEDRAKFEGTTQIDLIAAEETLVDGVNQWLRHVHEQGFADQVAMPLAINCPARSNMLEGITRLSDVLTIKGEDGWKARSFMDNEAAQAAMGSPSGQSATTKVTR